MTDARSSQNPDDLIPARTLLKAFCVVAILLVAFVLYVMHHVAGAEPAAEHKAGPNVTIQACFTGPTQPGNCQEFIIDLINSARGTIHMQAYEFTDGAIAEALIARHRDLKDIVVIVDKSQRTQRYSMVPDLARAGIIVAVDAAPKIAHNKDILIDPTGANPAVETGSLNYTTSAENRNAENAVVIRNDTDLARQFETYFEARYRQSEPW
jgi:phosphatidylserine/phosphatidylglycerophosphate/cardiolipin synthase-like enzyme